MSTGARFRVNSPNVAWEDFQEEIVIVNLATGQYFSTRASGADIWRYLAKGASLSMIEERLLAAYDVESTLLADSLASFISTLQERGLVAPQTDSVALELAAEPAPSTPQAFLPPVLEEYSDMQDLLLLDPIHEVDESGWPNPR